MKKILAVDDQPEILDMITDFLEGKYEVYQAKTTARASALLSKTKFDCILLDVVMPGISGVEFFEYLHKQTWYEKTPVIFVSSESDFQTVLKTVKLGAVGYIKKPVEKDMLLKQIEAAVESDEKEQRLEEIKRAVDSKVKKVLAVDDQPETLDMIADFLKNKYEVYQAKTTARASALLSKIKFDCILLDVVMPGISGVEFFEYLQQQTWYERTPVIFASSESDFQTVLKTVKLGAVGYIKKPVEKDMLLRQIEAAITEHMTDWMPGGGGAKTPQGPPYRRPLPV
jgi:DNA-binding response OmpR family regulator